MSGITVKGTNDRKSAEVIINSMPSYSKDLGRSYTPCICPKYARFIEYSFNRSTNSRQTKPRNTGGK